MYFVIKTLKHIPKGIIILQNENVFYDVKFNLIQLNILRIQSKCDFRENSKKAKARRIDLPTEKGINNTNQLANNFFPILVNY